MESLKHNFKDNQFIKVLGSYGGKSTNMQLSSLQISKNTVIDAGSIIYGLGDNIIDINTIFITHSHLDHLIDIPFLIDNTFEERTKPLKIYGRKKTLENIRKHLLNWEIWPDFTKINLLNSEQKAIELIEIELEQTINVDGYDIKAIKNNHTNSSNGYLIQNQKKAILFTSDTYCCDSIWEEVNNNDKISSIIIDVSFPSRLEKLAYDSKHLTPKLLKEEMKKLKRDDLTVHINHLKPSCKDEIVKEIEELNLLLNGGRILQSQDLVKF